MPIKVDIQSRADIEKLVNAFYTRVKKDEQIGFIFTQVVPISWDHHMPIMYEFWETVLLGSGNYRGNPIRKHIAIDKLVPLGPIHFARWRKLFFEILDEHFVGAKAEEAKKRVMLMESLMLAKISDSRKDGFIQ